MKLHIYITFATIALTACISCAGNQNNKKANKSTLASNSVAALEVQDTPHYKFTFLGHDFDCSEKDLYAEFGLACEQIPDVDFDIDRGNITICGVGFHVNTPEKGPMFLLSSVTAESDEIVPVRELISKYHGESEYWEPYHYEWKSVSNKDYDILTSLRIRRIHSDEGGTVIFINTLKLSGEAN